MEAGKSKICRADVPLKGQQTTTDSGRANVPVRRASGKKILSYSG